MKRLLVLLFALAIITGCRQRPQPVQEQAHDLPAIIESGELRVLTLYNSTSYFNYRGQEMGFQYELATQFAQSLGVKLNLEVATGIPDMLEKLAAGQADLIAYNIPVTLNLKDSILYCGEEVVTHQVLVQRNRKEELIEDVTELIGKEVHVPPGKYYDRLLNLNSELGGGIVIKLHADSVNTEDLITQVAKGQIAYTLCDNDVAQLNKTYYPQLNIRLPVSYDQRSAWVVRKECMQLAAAATAWHTANETSPAYQASAKRYFEISKAVPYTAILSLAEGKISHFDPLFKKYAPQINWDWRLLAALAYTESNFDTTVVSWAGAQGLMQLMPATAHAMGMPPGMEQNPEESIKAAVKYIGIATRSLKSVEDQTERINFVLAAYNAGLGHVYDAMALARKYGDNPQIWFNETEKYILLKSNEEYFNDSVCRNGYFRGIETYNFVRDINSRFENYKRKIKE